MNANALSERIEKHEARITVIGQGYVGMPLAIAFAHAGYKVIGLDNSREKVESLNNGRSPIPDVAHSDLQEMRAAGRYSATTDYSVLADTDVAIVCVPTPLRKTKDPDISYVIAAAEELAEHLHPGQLIVLESTTYPGTTEEILLPMFSEKGGEAGVDFFLAFSPERIDPANPNFKVRDIPKVVGGVTGECSKLAAKLYQQVVPKVLEVSSPRVAEMAKLYENVFRNVNIALANELALMCHRLGVNTREVIDAASTKPFGFMTFHPGPGVGGHCIGIDSQYLAWKMKLNGYDARFIHLAEEINQSMPGRVVQMTADALNNRQRSLKGAKVLALGVAYKPNVSDTRESPALEVIHLLQQRGAEVTYADPHVPSIGYNGSQLNAVLADEAAIKGADCVLILTDHKEFDYKQIAGDASLVVDTRNATWGILNPKAEVIRL